MSRPFGPNSTIGAGTFALVDGPLGPLFAVEQEHLVAGAIVHRPLVVDFTHLLHIVSIEPQGFKSFGAG